MLKRISTRLTCILILALPQLGWTAEHYATTYGYGLDKWATAWLLTRRVDPDSSVTVVKDLDELPGDAITFDVPGGRYVRTGDRSAFAAALDASNHPVSVRDERLARIVHEIEVAYWQSNNAPATVSVEHAFRRLQRGRDRVPPSCYLRFFDAVAAALDATDRRQSLPADRLPNDCGASADATAGQGEGERDPVREVALETVLHAMREGDEVVFVDVREPEEYAETRIPGAINIPIRELDDDAVAAIAGADLVVSYCVKDFRGFEMAKMLWRAGVQRSVIIKPYGLKGWLSRDLPVAGDDALSSERAHARLRDCLTDDGCREGLQ